MASRIDLCARRAAALLSAIAALHLSGAALAEPLTAADRETARSLMDQGDDRTAAKDPAGALDAYRRADAIMHLPVTAIAVAKTQEALGLLIEASDTATAIVASPKVAGENAAQARARTEASALASRVGARIPALRVTLEAPPAGAVVSIDGAPLADAMLGAPRKVNPGEHTVVARAPGYEDARAVVTVGEGAVVPVSLSLQRVQGPVVEPARAQAPAAPRRGSKPLAIAGFGVGAAGVTVGAVTGILSLVRTRQLGSACDASKTCPASAHADLTSATTLANVSNASFAIGAAGVAAGVVGLLLPRGGDAPESAPPRIEIRPAVGLGAIGVAGAF